MAAIKVSVFAEQERDTRMDKLGDALSKLAERVDFAALAAEIGKPAPHTRRERSDRPPFPMESTLRELVVQLFYSYNFSSEQAQDVGRREGSPDPDCTTIWTLKVRLNNVDATERILKAVGQKLDRHGYIARRGPVVDASIVSLHKQALNKDEKTIQQPDEMPAQWSSWKWRHQDSQTRGTGKRGKRSLGFKLPSSVDRRHKPIRRVQVRTACANCTLHFERVHDAGNTSRNIYAHRGHIDGEREQRIRAQGLCAHIQRKEQLGKPLSGC